MRLSQLVIPARDIERIRYWYMRYFAMQSSDIHTGQDGERSYRLSCPDDLCSLLVVSDTEPHSASRLAISVASRRGVDFVTELLRTDGNTIAVEPGEDVYGVYRSVVLDPEGNRVSIVE